MKTNRQWLGRIVLLAAGILLLAGCKETAVVQTPEARMMGYGTAWSHQDYAAMYELLSAEAKNRIARDAFVKRHQTIYEGISASGLDIRLVGADAPSGTGGQGTARSKDGKAKEGKTMEGPVTLRYKMSMSTSAGPVTFEQTASWRKEDSGWFIDWQPSLLFPDLREGDKVRVQTVHAERGEILDRRGAGLAINEEKTEIGIVPAKLPAASESALVEAAKLLQTTPADLDAKLHASWVKPDYFVPLALLPVGDTRLKPLLAVPGVTSQTRKARAYPIGAAAAHLTGYLSKISGDAWPKLQGQGYGPDDLIGKAGLELQYEQQLRGKDGVRIMIVDAAGKERKVIAKLDVVNGVDVHLTIDGLLQEELYRELAEESGAAAAVHPQTGEVLALVSTPSYDPNAFIAGVAKDVWNGWNTDVRKPLFNRFAATYAPGSAFKPLTGAIAIDHGTLRPKEEVTITGKRWQKDASWGNYQVTRVSEKSERVDLLNALQFSDNIYFAQAALAMGGDAFLSRAGAFGFGEKLPVPFPFESSKLVNAKLKNDIQLADSGYGQGEVQMSPLHVAMAYTAFTNKGTMLAPRLVWEDWGSGSATPAATAWKTDLIRPETAQLIADDLVQVVESPSGTGRGAKINGVRLAAKTGTAELKQSQGTQGKEIGWFVAFTADAPQLLVAMMAENVEQRGGSHLLAPKIKRVFEQALRRPAN